jgi:hypothetical protein
MKPHERILLDHLESPIGNTKDLTPNVKGAMGEVAYFKGNPLTKTQITINFKLTWFNTLTGTIIPPAALPPELKTYVSAYLFGLTDYYGYYNKLNYLLPSANLFNPPTISVSQSNNIISFAGQAFKGDLILTTQSVSIGGAQYWGTVLVHCSNVAYTTFLNSFVSDLITVEMIRYIVPDANIDQFINPIIIGYQTLFGKTFSDNIDPRVFITPKDFQDQISDIPFNLPVDKALMLGFNMNYNCPSASMVLFVSKVEALTHK